MANGLWFLWRDDLLMLLGENLCWSLLGPKRLKKNVPRRDGRIRRLAKFEMSAFESFFFFGDKFILIA